MRRIHRNRKGLMFIEAGFIFCKRHDLDYKSFFDKFYITEEFIENDDLEFEAICKDLRMFRYIDGYELKELTIEEYEMCVDIFGADIRK